MESVLPVLLISDWFSLSLFQPMRFSNLFKSTHRTMEALGSLFQLTEQLTLRCGSAENQGQGYRDPFTLGYIK